MKTYAHTGAFTFLLYAYNSWCRFSWPPRYRCRRMGFFVPVPSIIQERPWLIDDGCTNMDLWNTYGIRSPETKGLKTETSETSETSEIWTCETRSTSGSPLFSVFLWLFPILEDDPSYDIDLEKHPEPQGPRWPQMAPDWPRWPQGDRLVAPTCFDTLGYP